MCCGASRERGGDRRAARGEQHARRGLFLLATFFCLTFEKVHWKLRRTLTTYDAAYVALAETLDVPLLTTDERIARSHGHRAEILVPRQ